MRKKITWILALVLLVLLVGVSTLYRKLTAKQAGSQLQAEAEGMTATENPAAGGQDNITSKASTGSTTGEGSEALTATSNLAVQEASGVVYELSKYEGKPIVLNFWTNQRGPYRVEMPKFNETYKEHDAEVQFFMVNPTGGNRKTVKGTSNFIMAQDYSLPIFYDTTQGAARAYGVLSIPYTYFIDANGTMAAQVRGAIDKNTLLHGIGMVTTK